ncbi:MAG: glycoside hydrolase family 16 protein [Prevotellaceae bacterium]|nr:glycoside hydrolase family 16 protein [Prevotellaceae bacterium]
MNEKKTWFHVWNQIIIAVTLLVILTLCAAVYMTADARTPSKRSTPKYTLIMQDDFNGDSINSKYWNIMTRNSVATWAKWQSTNKELFDVSNGRLRLYGKVNNGIEPNDTARYLLSGIESRHKVKIRYGKVEVRARMNGVEGCVPAIWMSTESYLQYPDFAEIDLLEHIGTFETVSQTIHNNYTDKLNKKDYPKHQVNPVFNASKYNVYAA